MAGRQRLSLHRARNAGLCRRPFPCALLHPIKSPESNGVSEAFVKTLKRDYARVQSRPDALTVLAQLSAWIDNYNECQPHRGLRMRSPREFIRDQRNDRRASFVRLTLRKPDRERDQRNPALLVSRHVGVRRSAWRSLGRALRRRG